MEAKGGLNYYQIDVSNGEDFCGRRVPTRGNVFVK